MVRRVYTDETLAARYEEPRDLAQIFPHRGRAECQSIAFDWEILCAQARDPAVPGARRAACARPRPLRRRLELRQEAISLPPQQRRHQGVNRPYVAGSPQRCNPCSGPAPEETTQESYSSALHFRRSATP